ncbi:MAG: ABC transporter ATP-binding protein, partial [Lentisphaeria bacterium]
MNETPLASLRGLRKWFGKKQALDGITLDIPAASIVGLIGANGSGKSTLLRHLVGLYLPDAGSVTTLGRAAGELTPAELARIGYVHQEGELLEWMKVTQLLRYTAAYYPTWNRALEERYCAQFELPLDARVGTLSPGQRQMLAVLLAIAFEPDLLLLDEPAAAMDPLARRRFLDWLIELIQAPGRTIVISSHILTDVEKVVDRVVIMNQGRVLRDCAMDDLREEFLLVHLTPLAGALPRELPFGRVLECRRDDTGAQLILAGGDAARIQEIAERIGATA